MNTLQKTLAGLALLASTTWAHALDIKPYTPQGFAELQAANQAVALHFHADWCSTCKAQEKVFNGWKGDANMPGTLLVVNYDNEKELRKKMSIRMQSTVVSFKGSAEKARLAGDTDQNALRNVLEAAR